MVRAAPPDPPQDRFQRALFAAETGLRPYAILVVLSLALFATGLGSLPPTDRDEARFMQATKQMIESGDYVHIRVQDAPRTKKPIGIHWLQAIAVQALQQPLDRPWPYRVPSVLGALLAVLSTCWAGRRLFGARAGLVAGAMMATLPLMIGEAHLAKTDAVLTGAITLAMAVLGWLYVDAAEERRLAPRWRPLLVFWLAVGAAVLVKGPVVLLVAGATIATLAFVDRRTRLPRLLQPGWGIPLALLVVAPWLFLLIRGGDAGFVASAVREDLLPKLLGAQESHGAAPGTYLVASILTAWPWSLMMPIAVVATWPLRGTPAIRFCLAWLVPAWLAFEAVPTKLPHYVLPLMPAAALLVGAAVQDGRRWRPLMKRTAGRVWRGLYVAISVGLGMGALWLVHTYSTHQTVFAVAAAASTLIVAGLALAAGRLPPIATCVVAVVASGLFCSLTVDGILPRLERVWVSRQLASALSSRAPGKAVALAGYHEPSAVFLLGTGTVLTDAAGAASFLGAAPGRVAVVESAQVAGVAAALSDAGLGPQTLGQVEGYDYPRDAWVALSLVIANR